LVAEFRPDLVHAHLPSAGVLARVSTSVPVVYTEHNIADSYRRPMRILNRVTYGRNRRVIAVSGPVAESLRGYPGPEPIVIPNGIPVEHEDPSGVRGEFGIEPSQRLIVHVGNIRPHKGHSNLVEATAILARRMPEVMVLSAGAEKAPGDLARVNREAEDLGVSPHIRFLGRREDGRRLLAAADVVVNPSDVEGLPVTILEALSYARPVVATDVGGVSKVIEHGRTGLLVPANDPEGLASALEKALTDPTAASWGEQGRALVSTHHSIEAMVRSYEDVYRTVVDA
jgi:glycosyltransferase involved in cell wall biosynthesis